MSLWSDKEDLCKEITVATLRDSYLLVKSNRDSSRVPSAVDMCEADMQLLLDVIEFYTGRRPLEDWLDDMEIDNG